VGRSRPVALNPPTFLPWNASINFIAVSLSSNLAAWFKISMISWQCCFISFLSVSAKQNYNHNIQVQSFLFLSITCRYFWSNKTDLAFDNGHTFLCSEIYPMILQNVVQSLISCIWKWRPRIINKKCLYNINAPNHATLKRAIHLIIQLISNDQNHQISSMVSVIDKPIYTQN
jgi:hypothetical protein